MKTTLRSLVPLLLVSLMVSCGGGSSVAGTYKLDVDAMVKKAEAGVEAAKADKDNPMAGAMAAMVLNMVKTMTATAELKSDGSVTLDLSMKTPMGDKNEKATGTWKQDGDKITMTTEKDGKKETQTATLVDGNLVVKQEGKDGPPMEMIFKKQ